MHLVEAERGHWHNIVVEDIGIVVGRHTADVHSSLAEAIVDLGVASIDQHIVVVTQGLRAVQVKDDVAVSVLQKVTLRLLQVHELKGLERCQEFPVRCVIASRYLPSCLKHRFGRQRRPIGALPSGMGQGIACE